MTQPSGTVTEAGTPALSFPQRVVGMLFSPRATFESVVAHPKWLDVFLLVTAVLTIAWAVFLWSPVGSQAFLDNLITQAERSGQPTNNLQTAFPIIRMVTVIAIPIVSPIFTVLIAGLLYGVFAAILGGGASYKQVIAVVVHSGLVSGLGQLVVLILNYVRGTMTSATNFSVFAPMLEENSFLFKLLSVIDLVWIWYLFILAMGLAVLYRRKTATIATSFYVLYLVIAVIVAFFKRGA